MRFFKNSESFFLIILIVLYGIGFSTEQYLPFILLSLILTFIRIEYGVFAYLLSLPSLPLIFGIVLAFLMVVVFLISHLSQKNKIIKAPLVLIFFITIHLIMATLFSGYYEYFHVSLLFIISLLSLYVVFDVTAKKMLNKDFFKIVVNPLILSGLIVGLLSLVESGFEFRRLTLGGITRVEGGNVRQLANPVAISFIFLLMFYIFPNKDKYGIKSLVGLPITFFISKIKYLIAFILIIILAFTASRGVLFSTLSVFLFLALFNNKSVLNWLNYVTLIFFFLGGAFLFTTEISLFDFNSLQDRLNVDSVSGGLDSRMNIWKAGLSQLEGINLLFGHGIAGFRQLALQSGYDYYAHSTFIDMIATVGVLGSIVIFINFVYLFLRMLRQKNKESMIVLFISIMLFSTHGRMDSQYYWVLIFLAYALVYRYSLLNKITE